MGIVESQLKKLEEGLYEVKQFVLKAERVEDAPLIWLLLDVNLLTPEIFELLEKTNQGAGRSSN